MFKPSLAVAAAVGLLVIGALLTSRRDQPVIGNPSPSLPGVVAASPTPSAHSADHARVPAFDRCVDRDRVDAHAPLRPRLRAAPGWPGACRGWRQRRRERHLRRVVRPGQGHLVRDREHAQAPRWLPTHVAGGRQGARGRWRRPERRRRSPLELGAEVYDPASGTWTATGKMITPTKGATATLLRDGTVLVIGTDGAELYDPDSGTWTATGRMTQRHEYHAAVLLPDGKVLVAGGYVYDQLGYVIGGVQESAELYDPATGTWVSTASMSDPRNPISLTPLSDGKVLVAGGWHRPALSNRSPSCTTRPGALGPPLGRWPGPGRFTDRRRSCRMEWCW